MMEEWDEQVAVLNNAGVPWVSGRSIFLLPMACQGICPNCSHFCSCAGRLCLGRTKAKTELRQAVVAMMDLRLGPTAPKVMLLLQFLRQPPPVHGRTGVMCYLGM